MRKAFLLCTVFATCILTVSAARQQTLYGYISCSKCASKSLSQKQSHRECMEKCLASGSGIVLVTDDDHHVIPIDNPEAVKGHHAHRVALDGYMNGDSFHVISVRII